MSALLYRGFNSEGRRFCGSKNFKSEDQMKSFLDKRGITNYEIFKSKTVYKPGMYKVVSPKELSVFCKQLSVLFYSHMTLMEGILTLAEQSENKQLKAALTEIYEFMDKGGTFAETICMYDHIFPSYLLNMISIGETSGTLDIIFARLSLYYDKESKIRKKIRSAVTYPAVLSVLMTAIVVLIIVKILPMFSDIMESMGSEMPEITRMIFNSASFLTKYAPVIILAIAVILAAFIFFIRTDKGKQWYDKAKLSMPVYRYVNSRVIASRFSRSLAILLKSGVQLLNALEDISVLMGNSHLEGKLIVAVEKVRNGEEIRDVLNMIGIFPALFLKMFVIGHKTGNLDEMLDKTASVFDDEVDDAIDRFTSMLEPILIIILSIIVGIILLSVMFPMISVMNAIG